MTNSSLRYERLPDESADHGKPPLKGYCVSVDGKPVGLVFQVQYRWSRMTSNGRIRLRDYYPVEWAYSTDTRRLDNRWAPRYQRARTRKLAVEFLLRLVKEQS